MIASTRSAYAQWQAANQVIVSSRVAVEANTLALEGVRAENSVGTRTILDILDAERELLKAAPDIERSYLEGLASEGALASSFGPRERERTLARAKQTNDDGASSS